MSRRGTNRGPAGQPQNLTFVFTDIEGSTRLLERLRDRYAAVLAEHGELIRAAAARWGGEPVDTQGDAFFLVFPAPAAAVSFAAALQRTLDQHEWPEDTAVRVRIGIHTGTAARTATGYVGLDVHRAARIAAAGHGGQVLVSAEAAAGLAATGLDGAALRPLGAHRLKDFARPVALHQLVVAGLPADFPPPRSVDAPDEPPAPGEPPYLGLAHFEEADADRFFGREAVVARLVARLADHPFLAVIGASGSGKSSLLRAGLLPSLRAQAGTAALLLTPSAAPLTALAAALRRDDGAEAHAALAAELRAAPAAVAEYLESDSLVVVDQGEELFSLCRDDAERAAFVAALLVVPDAGARLVVGLRADFYDRLAGYPRLCEMVAAHQEYLGPMSPDELRMAITGPAEAGGWRFAPGLVELIDHDVGTEPGALPLLSHALRETWQRRRGSTLTLRGYLDAGGVQGAIARSADRLMAELDPAQQATARAIFLRLTELGSDTPDTRRRAGLDELLGGGDPRAKEVLERLAAARLVVVGADSAEVAHEALIREWPTLREWLERDREGLRLHRALTEAAAEWQRAGRDESLVYRGARLASALDWAAEHGVELNAAEREFLDASRAAAEREAERQRRTNRRLRALLAGTALLLVAAVGAGAFAAMQADRAEQEATAARQAEDVARSRELAASAINALDDDPGLAKLLALSAASIADPPLAVISALHRAYAADPVIARYSWPEDGHLWTDLHPSGRLLVASGATPFEAHAFESGNYLEVADLATGDVLWSHRLGEDALSVGPARFSPNGEWVVAGVYWEPLEEFENPPPDEFRDVLGIQIWDAETGEPMDHFDLGRCGGIVIDMTDTHLLARTRADAFEECWALGVFGSPGFEVGVELIEIASDERQLLTSRAPIMHDNYASLSDDGRHVAFEDWTVDPPLGVMLDLDTGDRALEWEAFSTGADNPALREANADGSLFLEGLRPIQVWDVARGEVIASLDGLGLGAFPMFGPSGETVYTTSGDGTLRRWDARTGVELWAVQGIGSGRISVVDDGLVLVSDPETGEAVLVDAGARGEVAAVGTCQGGWRPAVRSSLNAVGGVAAFHGACSPEIGDPLSIHLIDLAAGALLHSIEDVDGQVIRLSPDGTRLAAQGASGGLTGPILVRDVRTGAVLVELEGVCQWDEALSLLNGVPQAETGDCQPYPEQPFPLAVRSLAWSPDGSLIAAAQDWVGESYLAVWDAATGELLFTVQPGGAMIFVDGDRLLIAAFEEPELTAVSTRTWEVLQDISFDPTLEGGDGLGLVGYAADGRTLLAVGGFEGGGAALHWLDAQTLEVVDSKTRIHEGSPTSMALSPDRSILATGASDGFVRVWDTHFGALVHEIPIGDTTVQGLAFVNDRHLAVTPLEGNLLVFTVDTGELLEIVRASLTRGFTETECERFNFGAQCPTLEDLRGDDELPE